MPKQIKSEELDRIVNALAQFTEGAGIDLLLKDGNINLPRRTLQRRLAQLVKAKRISTEGEGRALRYRVARKVLAGNLTRPSFSAKASAEAYVPLSPEGHEIRKQICKPRQGRKPVSYSPAFLEAYIPNDSAYLPENLRLQLHKIGRAPGLKQTAGTFARDILNRLLIDLSWASSQLEGNTYSLLDTKRLIELGQKAEGKDVLETQIILNHRAAIEMLVMSLSGRMSARANNTLRSKKALSLLILFVLSTALALKEFNTLYEGNISRFRLAPSEFNLWQDAVNKRDCKQKKGE